jgi:hypothetical protein
LDGRKGDGVDGKQDNDTEETTYRKREKNQTKTTREQGEHIDKRGREGKAKPFPPPRQSRTRRQEKPH